MRKSGNKISCSDWALESSGIFRREKGWSRKTRAPRKNIRESIIGDRLILNRLKAIIKLGQSLSHPLFKTHALKHMDLA